MPQDPHSTATFPESRSSGVLLPIFSLPSRFGIGDLGSSAYAFADRLIESGQRYWQVLPLDPPNAGADGSPYFSSSVFAGNPLLIDLDSLGEEGLLGETELVPPAGMCATVIDYDSVSRFKLDALDSACRRFRHSGDRGAFEAFRRRQQFWLGDYALFTALAAECGSESWRDWPAGLRDREAAALEEARKRLTEKIEHQEILQFFFFQQWERLKRYCNDRGLQLFGDMPIYSSPDSADVWSNSEIYQLDGNRNPVAVSGVPPDYFSSEGQLWNNPLYDWHELERQGFRWWIERMKSLFERFNIVRIDHFRGLVQYWEVSVPCETAVHGSWRQVPTFELFDALKSAFPRFPVVAEDLGTITPDVLQARDHYDMPGMLVMQFAFGDDHADNPYLPHNHRENSVVYFGSHDNNTARGWLEEECDEAVKSRLCRYLPWADDKEEMVCRLMEMVMSSRARLAIVSAQDLLALPSRARINVPGSTTGNWRWRLSQAEFDAIDWEMLVALTRQSGRHTADHNTPARNPSN